MKISELIITLNDVYKQHGDIEVTDTYQNSITCIAIDSTNEKPTVIITDDEFALPDDFTIEVFKVIP